MPTNLLLKTSHISVVCGTRGRSFLKFPRLQFPFATSDLRFPKPSSAAEPLIEALPKTSLTLCHVSPRVPSCTSVVGPRTECLTKSDVAQVLTKPYVFDCRTTNRRLNFIVLYPAPPSLVVEVLTEV